jgi:Flp pilus assembly protein TadG
MKKPFIRRPGVSRQRTQERGVTMVLVVTAMVAIIGMAALSIDVITLYLAREEAQRSADAAALAAARVISISGITGMEDPDNDTSSWKKICGDMTSAASLTAQAVAQQNAVGGSAPTISVKYSVSGSAVGNTDCSGLTQAFAINPTVIVQVTRASLPTLFSRIWSRNTNTVSATAIAEAFNPSGSGSFTPGGDLVAVVPRCVKPWIIPNKDPATGANLVDASTGAIQPPYGIRLSGVGTGVIGESLLLQSDCKPGAPNCSPGNMKSPPPPAAGFYIPALVTQSATAFPTCADDSLYQKAIGGCDTSTVYACGTPLGSQADLTINPGGAGGDTSTAAQCLIHQSGGVGQDILDTASYPYQTRAGSGNPVITSGVVTASNSIVTVPIYDDAAGSLTGGTPAITIVGFLQVFIDNVDTGTGNMNVHVLNIAGCGNDAAPFLSAPGTSPVPIRLITSQ